MDIAESERSFEEIENESGRAVEALEEENFASVDELQNHGVGAADIQKLKLAGICTIKVLCMISVDFCLNC
jgi:hypothetical protein